MEAVRKTVAICVGDTTGKHVKRRLRVRYISCKACGFSSEEDRFAGKLLFSPVKEPWWDSVCSFHPIVLKEPSSAVWRMYYYGRDSASWHSGVTPALLSSGRIGVASSSDGINWSRTLGSLPHGAIMDPHDGHTAAFDSVHVGCSDVFFYDGMWWMYYFGGGLESMSLPTGRRVTGMRLRTGLAKSYGDTWVNGFDENREKERILDVGASGEWDEMMVAWARVIPKSPTHPCTHWLMTYASMCMISTSAAPSFCIGVALSQDGHTWTKMGKVLEPGEPGSWDEGGVSRRHVIFFDGLFLMFYEGISRGGAHAIGLATSKDGITWVKDKQGLDGQPGGPIFSARVDWPEAWDSGSVSCPHVVKVDDCFWLYYTGFDATKKVSAFGVARSDGYNYRSFRRMRIIEKINAQ
eukprot:c24357_g1_i1 orf=221-1444(-)